MTKTIYVDENLTKEEKYKTLLQQVEYLLEKDDLVITNLSNFIAAIRQTFDTISWVGFYLARDNKLYLGPFQGKTACTMIQFGNGVCGDAAQQKRTVIVPDVDQYPGHIACDSASRSEIVVPLIHKNMVYGVLDLDSTILHNFDETDKTYLEKLCGVLLQFVNFEKFILS